MENFNTDSSVSSAIIQNNVTSPKRLAYSQHSINRRVYYKYFVFSSLKTFQHYEKWRQNPCFVYPCTLMSGDCQKVFNTALCSKFKQGRNSTKFGVQGPMRQYSNLSADPTLTGTWLYVLTSHANFFRVCLLSAGVRQQHISLSVDASKCVLFSLVLRQGSKEIGRPCSHFVLHKEIGRPCFCFVLLAISIKMENPW